MGSIESRESRIRGLDGVRGLAALGVFVHHKLLRGTYLGTVCVAVFFVLSGYLIIGILMRSRGSIEGGRSSIKHELTRFWLRRSLRVLPAYYLLLLGVPLLWLLVGESRKEPGFGWYFCYTQNFYIGYVSQTWGRISHLWSLAIEEQFYLLSAPLFILLPSRHHRRAAIMFVGVSVISLALMALMHVPVMTIRMSPVVNFGLMGCGAYLAWAHRHGELRKIDRSWLLLGVVLLGVGTYTSRIFPDPDAEAGGFQALYVMCLAGSTALLSYVIANPNSGPVRLLEWSVLRYLGTISYGVYLYHYVIPEPSQTGYMMRALPAWLGSSLQHYAIAAIMLAETLLVASLSWYLFERPLIKLKDRFDREPWSAPAPRSDRPQRMAADPAIAVS